MQLVVNIDGGSRGNPGPASAGVVIAASDGTPLHEAGYFLGTATNNVAEYTAFIRAIDLAAAMRPERVEFFSDSELMVKQIIGDYRVKSPDLKPLYERAQRLLLQLDSWVIKHVRREKNTRADELANLAMDAKKDVIVHDGSAFAGDRKATESFLIPTPVARKQKSWTATLRGKAEMCPAKLRDGQAFVFGTTTPAGCCIHAAAAAIGRITDDELDDDRCTALCDRCGVEIALTAGD